MDEKYLISGLIKKDRVVFDFIFNYYYSGLCAYASRWIDDQEEIEDLVQDFFVRLWINSSKLNIKSSLKSYFFTSIKNKAIDFLKHKQVQENFNKAKLQEDQEKEEHIGWEYTEPELMEIIENSLQKLPPRCREIFVLSRFDGIKNDDIATQLGISKRTVELQISNALKVLRTDLKEYLPSVLIFWLLK